MLHSAMSELRKTRAMLVENPEKQGPRSAGTLMCSSSQKISFCQCFLSYAAVGSLFLCGHPSAK